MAILIVTEGSTRLLSVTRLIFSALLPPEPLAILRVLLLCKASLDRVVNTCCHLRGRIFPPKLTAGFLPCRA